MGFDEINGQSNAVKLLRTAVRTGRISHAYLFYGKDGVGKNKTAQIFAQALNCVAPKEGEPCLECDNCRKIRSGNHPDLLKITPDGASLKIAQMRRLQERAYYRCYEGGFKVIIIDDAHLLTVEAANCLLKILEEPPEDTVFLLLAEDTKRLPPTVLSRTQPIPFIPLDEQVLAGILAQEGRIAAVPLSLAGGSAKKALEMGEGRDFQELREDVRQLLQDIGSGSYQRLLRWAESLDKDRSRTEMMLELLAAVYRDRLVRQAAGECAVILPFEAGRPAAECSRHDCGRALAEINTAYYYLQNNGNARLVWDVLLLNLHKIERKERGIDPVG